MLRHLLSLLRLKGARPLAPPAPTLNLNQVLSEFPPEMTPEQFREWNYHHSRQHGR